MRIDDVVANLELANRGLQILDIDDEVLLRLLQCCVRDVRLLNRDDRWRGRLVHRYRSTMSTS
jgi:hypothetical protein